MDVSRRIATVKQLSADAFKLGILGADEAIDQYYATRFEDIILDSMDVREFGRFHMMHEDLGFADSLSVYDAMPESRRVDMLDDDGPYNQDDDGA